MDSGEVGRFMLICVMTEVLKGFFEINFNFLEGLDCPFPMLVLMTKSARAEDFALTSEDGQGPILLSLPLP